MIFSKSGEYALKSIIYINKNFDKNPIGVDILSNDLELPKHYVSKLLQGVVKRGFLKSIKGIGGGYLPGDNDLTIRDLMSSIEGCDRSDKCVMGISDCNDVNPCPLHQYYKPIKKEINEEVLNKKISELLTIEKFNLK